MAFNPVPPKLLLRRGASRARSFALAFVKGRGSAWIPLSRFAAGIKGQIEAQSKQPAVAPLGGIGKRARRVFRNNSHDGISSKMGRRYILPEKSGPENIVNHYRYRGRSGLYNVLVNLPQPATPDQREAPPVAADSALPNDVFFLAKGSQFRRLVPTYAAGAKRPTSRNHFLPFVYGYLAKHTNNHFRPDRERRGWVLANVLRKS